MASMARSIWARPTHAGEEGKGRKEVEGRTPTPVISLAILVHIRARGTGKKKGRKKGGEIHPPRGEAHALS